jgi:hypothetical protein
MIDINNFFNPNDLRTFLSTPFNINGRTVACNGHILISIPEQDKYTKAVDNIGPVKTVLLSLYEDRDFVSMPENLVFPNRHNCTVCNKTGRITEIECKECDGHGEVEFRNDYNHYEFECKSCDGEGKIIAYGDNEKCPACHGLTYVYLPNSYVDVMGVRFNPVYIDYIINEQELEIAIDEAKTRMYFKAHDALGLIMGMKK